MTARYNNLSKEEVIKAVYYAPVAIQKDNLAPARKDFLKKYPFFKEKSPSQLSLASGKYFFEGPVILPEHTNLVIEKGTRLLFSEGAFFQMMGSLAIEGTEKERVVFDAQDPSKGWGGLKIVSIDKKIKMNHTVLKNINFPKKNGLGRTGAVSIYGGDIFLSFVRIENSKSEDALNLFRTKFSINHIIINDSKSDAIDFDFSDGKIENAQFSAIGGDALDLSGSQIEAAYVSAKNVGDKAISVGEKSNFHGKFLDIQNAVIGVASKDLSRATIENSSFQGITGTAFMAYIKKKEYGPSSLTVKETTVSGARALSEACEKCFLEIISSKKRVNVVFSK